MTNFHFCKVIFACFLCVAGRGALWAQSVDPNAYYPGRQISDWSVANAHSHNDYQQAKPFSLAYGANFGSMEADIFLVNDSLFVGHVRGDIARHRMLTSLYLDSVAFYLELNKGYPYANKRLRLQLLIDQKTEGELTLEALIRLLNAYPSIIHCKQLSVVITGNRPPVNKWRNFPAYIFFDGNFNEKYSEDLMPKIALFSADLGDLTKWNGHERINPPDSLILAQKIQIAHDLGKKVRFWNAPDFPNAWAQLIEAGVDWINTDHILELSSYFAQRGKYPTNKLPK